MLQGGESSGGGFDIGSLRGDVIGGSVLFSEVKRLRPDPRSRKAGSLARPGRARQARAAPSKASYRCAGPPMETWTCRPRPAVV